MLVLASIVTYSASSITNWRKARTAAEQLKAVYIAQKSFMADHPTASPSSLSSSDIIPYLPGNPGSLPSAKSLDDEDLTINISLMPPVLELGGSTYDPSDSGEDGLWDVGAL
jgi:type II secretory pathway pseudopilin PulG|tara:strand:- start:6596 stop:6931 length:336 start_codon:yes stop_codon:yes gene_type:complete